MLSMKQFFILCILVCVANCYMGIIRSEQGKSKTKVGFCEFDGVVNEWGESATPNKCEKYSCNEDYSIGVVG